MTWSETTTAEYALGQCADPTITPADGTVFGSSNYHVSIEKNGEKGVLRYTTDGSEPTAVGGAFEFAVGVAGVYVGEGATAENLAKIFGLEGGEKIGEMSADKVSVSFGEPTGGKVRLLAGPKDASLSTFFMRVRMMP